MSRSPAVLRVGLRFAETDIPVGRLAFDRGVAVLEYDAAFPARRLAINPLFGAPDARLLRAREPSVFDGLHGVFADSLPDAWGELLMRRGAEARGVAYEELHALDRLALVGSRGMGALTYRPEAAVVEEPFDLDRTADAAADVLRGEPTRTLAELEAVGASSGGARPKALVGIAPDGTVVAGAGDLPAGCEAWIVKFPGGRDMPEIGPLEAAYADMARAAGLNVAPTRLLPARRGPGYFATRRFDREGARRLHLASAAGLLETDWSHPTIEYGTLLALTTAVTKRREDVEAVFARMIFNVAAHNRDDHAKQHAFLMSEDGAWRAAPSYDLTFSRGPGGEHYLSVAGKGKDIAADDVAAVGRDHGIARARVAEIVERATDAVARFPEFARRYDLRRATIATVAKSLERTASALRVGRPR